MYYVVEFLNEGTGAVVPNTWMTGLKSCLWPPGTAEWKKKISRLVKCKSKPEDCFEAYNVRVIGTSESLKRAYEKLKKSSDTSDINTSEGGNKMNCGRLMRKRSKRKAYSSSDDSNDGISSDEGEQISSYIPPPKPSVLQNNSIGGPSQQQHFPKENFHQLPAQEPLQASSEQVPWSDIANINVKTLPRQAVTSALQNCSYPSPNSIIQQPSLRLSFGRETPSRSLGRPLELQDVDTTGMGVEALLQLNAEFHKQILRKLKFIEKELVDQREFLNCFTNASSQHQPNRLPNLPFELPVTSEDALMAVEEFLKTEVNQDIMIRHLKLVGGAEVDIAVRGILSRCFTNGLASSFTFNGLRKKKSFKSLILKKVVFSAVQLLYPDTTEATFSKIAGDWFRYAPRKKGGNKCCEGTRTTFRDNTSDGDEPVSA